jgi:hypothetical protein
VHRLLGSAGRLDAEEARTRRIERIIIDGDGLRDLRRGEAAAQRVARVGRLWAVSALRPRIRQLGSAGRLDAEEAGTRRIERIIVDGDGLRGLSGGEAAIRCAARVGRLRAAAALRRPIPQPSL